MLASIFKQLSPLYTDLYQLTMAQGYFLTGLYRQKAVFDLTYRTNPFRGGYLIVNGIDEAVECLANLHFGKDDLEFLASQGFHKSFLRYLKNFRFRLDMDGVAEGEIVFPHEPLLRVQGSLPECQMAETLLINLVHFPSLVATKASRIIRAAEGRTVIEFGLRRAQGLAGLQSSRAAFIGGADGTSNTYAGKLYDIPVFGTQAHSWIQAFRDEEKSFLAFSRIHRERTVLLIDTYNTLQSGLPHLLSALKKLRREKIEIRGVRIDSGDLAYLSKKVRQCLDREGFAAVKIFVSGQLDEYIIESLLKQGAKIDGFGVGTKLATSYDEPALDMVYKLAMVNGFSEIKITDSMLKMNEPGLKKVWRYVGDEGEFLLDAIVLEKEKKINEVFHPFFSLARTPVERHTCRELFGPVMRRGKLVRSPRRVREIRDDVLKRLARLPEEHKRFYYPHIYRVGVSRQLFNLKQRLITERMKSGRPYSE